MPGLFPRLPHSESAGIPVFPGAFLIQHQERGFWCPGREKDFREEGKPDQYGKYYTNPERGRLRKSKLFSLFLVTYF